jgi:predicted Zn-dependent protease
MPRILKTVSVLLLICFLSVPFIPAQGIKDKITNLTRTKVKEVLVEELSSEEFYQDMKTFAEGLYNKQVGEGETRRESDFKKRVDREYEALKREHADKAYKTNLSAHSEVKYVIEDRFRIFSGLYDNLLVQDLLNRTGQSVIPAKVERLYTFKLLADPIPMAQSLSTGTIYVSTGLVGLLETKAQLSYVLAHEAAHIYREHYKTRKMLELASEEYAKQRNANLEAVRNKYALFAGIAGAGAGAILGQGKGAAIGAGVATTGVYLGMALEALAQSQKPTVMDWNRTEEDEADQMAFEWVMNSKQNVNDIPKVYQVLKDAGDRDDRVTLAFLGRTDRVRERARRIEQILAAERAKPDFAKRVFQSGDPDFDVLLAEVKRDNGILAFHTDMLEMARNNLERAVAIKTTDPAALYYYGKILKQTARDDADRAKAQEYFRRAAENDHRNMNYGAELHRAVALLTPTATVSEKQQAVELLKHYLEGYFLSAYQTSRSKNDEYPPHLETIYDYLSRLGEYNYVLDGESVLRDAARRRAASTPTVEMPSQAPVMTPASSPPPKSEAKKDAAPARKKGS